MILIDWKLHEWLELGENVCFGLNMIFACKLCIMVFIGFVFYPQKV